MFEYVFGRFCSVYRGADERLCKLGGLPIG